MGGIKARVRAAVAVNSELVQLYWHVGRDILKRQSEQGWGAKVVERLSRCTRILGYDNADGKGHHKHLGGRESPSEFTSIERMIERFGREVAQLRRRMT